VQFSEIGVKVVKTVDVIIDVRKVCNAYSCHSFVEYKTLVYQYLEFSFIKNNLLIIGQACEILCGDKL
jgi:hypothetical protein